MRKIFRRSLFLMIMGCIKSKANRNESLINDKNYSWSNKEKVNPSDYTIENIKQKMLFKTSGSICGQQFIIQNCDQSCIGLFDYINTITIDDCTDCLIFIGPTIASVVVRNCANCQIMCACQQFRSRDCKDLDVFLYCATQPAIESCCNIRFACFSSNYSQLEEQFKRANLKIFNNKWWYIYDFTVNEDECHWSFIPPTIKAEDLFARLICDDVSNLTFKSSESVVPQTLGYLPTKKEETCLILIISNDNIQTKVKAIIHEMRKFSGVFLMRTREFSASTRESQLIFGVQANQQIIALEYKGKNSINVCTKIAKENPGNPITVISNPEKLFKHTSIIFNVDN